MRPLVIQPPFGIITTVAVGRHLRVVERGEKRPTLADADREDSSKVATLIAKGYGEAEVCRVLKLSRRRYQYITRLIQRAAQDPSVVWGKFSVSTQRNLRRLDALAEQALSTSMEITVVGSDGKEERKTVPKPINEAVAFRCIAQMQKIEERRIEVGQSLGIYPNAKNEDDKTKGDQFFLGLFVADSREKLFRDHGDTIPELTPVYELSQSNEAATSSNPD